MCDSRCRVGRRALVAAFSVCALATSAAAQQAAFELAGPAVRAGLAVRVASETPVEVRLDAVRSAPAALTIPLPSGERVVAARTGVDRHGPASLVWRGVLPPDGRVTLTLVDGHLAGLVEHASGRFAIVPVGGGHVLQTPAELAEPECAGAVPFEREAPFGHDGSLARPAAAAQAAAADTVELDMLVVYTTAARDAAGGTGPIQARIQSGVDLMNTAFVDSLVDARTQLVATVEVDYEEEGGDLGFDLHWIRNDDEMEALRNAVGADLVALVVQTSPLNPYCGRAYLMQDPGPGAERGAVQVSALRCVVANITLAHEAGHNLGLEHEPEYAGDPEDASFPWSFGHWVDGNFSTVMAYGNECSALGLSCPRVLHWSNPDVRHDGDPTGIVDERDNARTLRTTAPIVAAFREPAACSDGDADGYGAPGSALCPAGAALDCDDTDPAVHPGAVEIPGNGVDDDCNGNTPGGCGDPQLQ